MTSMISGLPERYRPLDEVGPQETTSTGVIRCWRAKDRVLNRDVAVRVHTPGGAAAHSWIARALTAGGLATPALAMVYDAAEGSDAANQGSPAYVVNEWIEGETLAERLRRGPLPEREARTVLRRLADGVAEAHRAGLAVGGLTLERIVLRPNGLVGVRAVPAASGTVQGDISALGALLQACLTGRPDGSGRIPQPDLAALVRRARSTEPGQGLTSAAAMAALLDDRPRARAVGTGAGGTSGPGAAAGPLAAGATAAGASAATGGGSSAATGADSGWLRRLRERRTDEPAAALSGTPGGPISAAAIGAAPPAPFPGAPPTRTIGIPPGQSAAPPPGDWSGGPTDDDEEIRRQVFGGQTFEDLPVQEEGYGSEDFGQEPAADGDDVTPRVRSRRRLLTIGVPILALAIVMAVAWWVGNNVLSVAGSVDPGSPVPPGSSAAAASASPSPSPSPSPAAGQPVPIRGGEVFDPFGDGEPENTAKVPLSYDGNLRTVWNTLVYKRPAFGNLKPGVGVLYDLGSAQPLAGVTLTTSLPGATMEIRTATEQQDKLDGYQAAGSQTVQGTADFAFGQPVTARYVLVWVTNLAEGDGGYEANIAELVVHSAR